MSTIMVPFNVSQTVKVKLKPRGMEHFRKMRERFNAFFRYEKGDKRAWETEPHLDEDGFYVTEMRTLMWEFGFLCVLGEEMPFESEIFLEVQIL